MGQASKKAQGLSSYLTTKQPEPLPDAPHDSSPNALAVLATEQKRN